MVQDILGAVDIMWIYVVGKNEKIISEYISDELKEDGYRTQ